MRRLSLLLATLATAGPIFAQDSAKVPDYLGFYALNIPGFHWEEGAHLQADYRRITGYLNLDHTNTPLFEAEGHAPVPLTLDQTSRLLLSVNNKQLFDLAGVEGTVVAHGQPRVFFVVFLAIVGDKQINLIPTLTSTQGRGTPRQGEGPGPGGGGGPPGRGGELRGTF